MLTLYGSHNYIQLIFAQAIAEYNKTRYRSGEEAFVCDVNKTQCPSTCHVQRDFPVISSID